MVYIQAPVSINITLMDVEGKILHKAKDTHGVSLKNLAEGIYLLRISTNDGTLIKMEKIVKQGQ